MVQCIADRLCSFGFTRKARELVFKPAFEVKHERLASFLADTAALLGASSADCLLDGIDLRNPSERFARDRRLGILLDIIELAAHMRPAEGERNGFAAGLAGARLVGRIAVALHHAAVAGEQLECVNGATAWRVGISDRGRITPAPGPVIAGNRPEVPLLGLAASRIEHWRRRLVDRDLGG